MDGPPIQRRFCYPIVFEHPCPLLGEADPWRSSHGGQPKIQDTVRLSASGDPLELDPSDLALCLTLLVGGVVRRVALGPGELALAARAQLLLRSATFIAVPDLDHLAKRLQPMFFSTAKLHEIATLQDPLPQRCQA